MKSRMIMSMMVIAIAAAVVGGATMAWFTDEADTGPVEFQAGTLLVDIDNNFDVITLDVDNLNPGDDFEWEVTVENEGSKNLIHKVKVCWQDILGEDLNDFGDRDGFGTDPLSDVIVFTVKDDEDKELTSGTLEGEDSPLDFEHEVELEPGETKTYAIHAEFPTDAGNEYQGSRMEAAFVAMAKQIHDDAEYGDFECPLPPLVKEGGVEFEDRAGVRYRAFGWSGGLGQQIFMGKNKGDNDQGDWAEAGLSWGETQDVSFVYDADNNTLQTEVDGTTLEYTGVSLDCDEETMDTMQINVVSRDTEDNVVRLKNVELNGASLGDFEAEHEDWNSWRVTGFNFSEGFTLDATLELDGDFPDDANQELSKVDILFGCVTE